MGKTKGEKYVIKKLNDYSSQEAETFSNKKEVYFDAMDTAIQNIKKHLHSADGKSINALMERAEGLGSEKNAVENVLEDVKKTIEYNID
ncbi:MAG: hypothetical protein ACK5G7_04800 [Erysipelotrichaceae bacterium]